VNNNVVKIKNLNDGILDTQSSLYLFRPRELIICRKHYKKMVVHFEMVIGILKRSKV